MRFLFLIRNKVESLMGGALRAKVVDRLFKYVEFKFFILSIINLFHKKIKILWRTRFG